jgi:eukaryotic-like serine/threonine-protein kinase
MGFVYKGTDPATGRTVALKTVPRKLLEQCGAAMSARFQNEAQAASRLRHPGIVAVYEFGERPELAFIAMEFVDGAGLTDQLRVPVADAVSITVQLLDALDYAHEQGVVHYDIKPSNVLITPNGQVKISDFGVARLDDSIRVQQALSTGEASYMSPEQFMGWPVDRRSDLFSAGVLLYGLLTGANPFSGPREQLVDRVCNDKERAPSEVNPELPPAFDAVCARALAKAVYDRYPTARAFRDAVREAYRAAYHATSPNLVSQETVARVGSARARLRSERRPMVQQAQPSPKPGARNGWDEATLRAVEHQLATYVGPLARIIVKEAASRTNDLDRLYSLVAASVDNEEERKAFLSRKNELPRNGSKAAPAAPIQAMPSSPPAAVKPALERKIVSAQEIKPKPEIKPDKPRPAPEVQAEPRVRAEPPVRKSPPAVVKSPAKPAGPEPAWQLMGAQQPESLAGYLSAKPPVLDRVIHGFVATVEAFKKAYTENPKLEALTPESVRFDAAGTASIKAVTGSTPGSGGGVVNARYAAPESFAEAGESASAMAAHVYALGFMFYEILLGKQLFDKTFAEQRSDLDWLRWHADLDRKAPPMRSLLPACPIACSELLESMMEKHAPKRLQDVDVILARMRTIAKQAETTMVLHKAKRPSASPAVGKKHGKAWIVLLVLVLLASGGGVYLWLNPDVYQSLVLYFSQLVQTISQSVKGR